MQPSADNPKAMMLASRLIFITLLTGLVTFSVVTVVLTGEDSRFGFDTSDPFTFAAIIFAGLSIPAGYFLSDRIYKNTDPEIPLSGKMASYQKGMIIRLACCEAPGLFSLVCILITGNLFFAVIFLAALFFILVNFPTPEKAGQAVNLSESQADSLR